MSRAEPTEDAPDPRPSGARATGQADGGPDVVDLLDSAVTALGGRRREGQTVMARAVGDALRDGEHLLVQAGTGTGKSLGYLVPAVRHAVMTDERVVVSTATLALQRQVMTRDLPLVAAAVAPALPRPPQVALLKGWHNYLCVHKLAGGYPQEDAGTLFEGFAESPGAAEHPAAAEGAPGSVEPEGRRTGGGRSGEGSLGHQVVRLRAWAEETTTGDRDDLVPGVSDRAWRQVSVTAMECLGSKCPMFDECLPERARGRAREADVVVTNHAMLGIAASGSPGVLPEHEVLVVDEAHELADRVTAQATAELSAPTLDQAARWARRHGGVATTELDAATEQLASALVVAREGRLRELSPDLADAVVAVRDATRTLLTALRPTQGAGENVPDGGLKMANGAVLTLFEIAERITGDRARDGHDVLWVARSETGVPRLHVAPLAVAGLVRTHLLTGRTAVLTSATLTLGGDFGPAARAVGLEPEMERTAGQPAPRREGDAPRPWRGLDVGSPFDYPRSGILYVARHLPAPGREPTTQAQLDEIEQLVVASGGAALGLFSSRRAAVAAAEAMRERLDVPVLCQGDDQLPTLVRQFAEDEATCLFGTLSLWQGVDVPGPSCRLVIIDRIPFPRPDDPIRSARAEAVDAAGGNGFMAVSATHAALLLAQGSGRLVRTTTDRGVVAVLDPRLATARYGGYLARSMPPFWTTTDGEVARGALRRLAQAAHPAPRAGAADGPLPVG